MKILIFLLISLNCFAKISVDITNDFGKSYKAKFETQAEADAWINDNISNDSWGKKERWLNSSEVEDLSKCLERKDIVPEVGKQYEICKLPKEYSILICDNEQTYSEGDPCKPITDDMKAKKAKKNKRQSDMQSIKAKLLDGSVKIKDIINYLKIKEGL